MPDCTAQYQAYQAALTLEAAATADWAVQAAEEYLARLVMQSRQAQTMQAYQSYLACMMGLPMMPKSQTELVMDKLIEAASEMVIATREVRESIGAD